MKNTNRKEPQPGTKLLIGVAVGMMIGLVIVTIGLFLAFKFGVLPQAVATLFVCLGLCTLVLVKWTTPKRNKS